MTRFLLPLTVVFSASGLLLVDSAIKGAALLVFASLVVLMLRRDSAATRHLVWLVAIVAMLFVPALSALLPQWRVLPEWATLPTESDAGDTVPVNGSDVMDVKYEANEIEMTFSANHFPAAEQSEPAIQSTRAMPSPPIASAISVAATTEASVVTLWTSVLPFVWAVGFLLLIVRLLAARLLLWQVERTARIIPHGERQGVSPPCLPVSPINQSTVSDSAIVAAFNAARLQLAVRGRITLLIHPDKTIPVVWGIIRHRLLLPAAALEWSDEQIRSVLLHELAHIKRRDALAQLLAQIACALHWFNPLVWFAAWRLHVERERACDDLVLASGVRASAYAEHLLNVATRLSSSPWTQACGLAMARSSSLHGRLAAVLSENRNRRSVSTFVVAACLLLGATILIPVAMLGAVDENQADKHEAPATEDSVKGTATANEGSAMRLEPGMEEHLDWSEPVNGLRGAVRIRTMDSAGIAGRERKIFVVIQNVSDTPIRFCDTAIQETDVPAADTEGRILYLQDNGEILSGRQRAVSTHSDIVLQPQDVVSIDMLNDEKANEQGLKSGDGLAEGIVKVPTRAIFAVLNIVHAPDGAWTGKLTTPSTRGAFAAEGPMPTSKEGQAFFRYCVDHARLNGDIPGGLISRLHDMVQEFIRLNTGDQSGDSYAKKMQPLVARFENKGDWKQGDVVTLFDDIASVTTIPLERTMEMIRENTLQRGQQLPASLKDANWGEALPGGLRMAWVLEPRSEKYHLGAALKSHVVIHNSGSKPVMFVTRSFHQPGHTAKQSSGGSVNVESTFWTTRGRPEPYRLRPDESCEVYAPGIGIGPKNNDDEDWANIRPGSWILANEGDDIVFQPGDVLLSGDHNEKVDPDWWLKFITERISRDAPFPDDPKEREVILFRVISDLFGNSPTPEEAAAFLPDTSPEAVQHLATLLSGRTWHTSVAGPIKSGETKFHVLPEDPDAATRPRIAMNPGRYNLGEDVRFVVTRRSIGERIVNEADVIWYPAGKDNVPVKVSLPDGYDTWAAAWAPDTTVLWVSQKGLLRSYDFTDPAVVKETRYEGDQAASARIPAEVREALRAAVEKSDVPAEQPKLKPPAAPAPAINAVDDPAQRNPNAPPQVPVVTLEDVAPRWKHLWNDSYSAVAAQKKDSVYFLLAYKGFISSGMSDSYSSTSGRWTFEGGVHLVDTAATQLAGKNVDKRVVSVKYSSDDPTTLFLDGKSFKLSEKPGVTGDSEAPGRIFLLSDKGDPIQIHQTVSLSDDKALDRIAEIVEQRLQQDETIDQLLMTYWKARGRTNGEIPGALVGSLGKQVEDYASTNPNLKPLVSRFDASHDWPQAEVIALLNVVMETWPGGGPVQATYNQLFTSEPAIVRFGQPLPADFPNVAWGTPRENGLRSAWLIEPNSKEHALGSILKTRLLIHNSGKEAIIFVTAKHHEPGNAQAGEIKMLEIPYTRGFSYARFRLNPGDYVEIPGFDIAVGEQYDQQVSVEAVIQAKAGDEVPLSYTVVATDGVLPYPDSKKDPVAEFNRAIALRVAEEAPMPASAADREQLIRRVVRDMFGDWPTPEEIADFIADDDADPLARLTAQLQHRKTAQSFVGEILTGETKIRVAAPALGNAKELTLSKAIPTQQSAEINFATINLAKAQVDLKQRLEANKKSPGAFSPFELTATELEVRKAAAVLRRAKALVLLEKLQTESDSEVNEAAGTSPVAGANALSNAESELRAAEIDFANVRLAKAKVDLEQRLAANKKSPGAFTPDEMAKTDLAIKEAEAILHDLIQEDLSKKDPAASGVRTLLNPPDAQPANGDKAESPKSSVSIDNPPEKTTAASDRSVSGRLLLSDGMPAVGYAVQLRLVGYFTKKERGGSYRQSGATGTAVETDEDGRFKVSVPEVVNFSTLSFTVSHNDFVVRVLEATKLGDLGTIQLLKSRVVTGRVLSAEGQPIANAVVTIAMATAQLRGIVTENDPFRYMSDFCGQITADGEGQFTSPPLEPGVYTFAVFASGVDAPSMQPIFAAHHVAITGAESLLGDKYLDHVSRAAAQHPEAARRFLVIADSSDNPISGDIKALPSRSLAVQLKNEVPEFPLEQVSMTISGTLPPHLQLSPLTWMLMLSTGVTSSSQKLTAEQMTVPVAEEASFVQVSFHVPRQDYEDRVVTLVRTSTAAPYSVDTNVEVQKEKSSLVNVVFKERLRVLINIPALSQGPPPDWKKFKVHATGICGTHGPFQTENWGRYAATPGQKELFVDVPECDNLKITIEPGDGQKLTGHLAQVRKGLENRTTPK